MEPKPNLKMAPASGSDPFGFATLIHLLIYLLKKSSLNKEVYGKNVHVNVNNIFRLIHFFVQI